MSQTLIIKLSDEVYAMIQRQAEEAGTSPADWLANALELQYGRVRAWQRGLTQRTAAEQQTARERFERHFGELDLSHATDADNEQIDADLVREYADTHEAP
jgi:hypothetical protein